MTTPASRQGSPPTADFLYLLCLLHGAYVVYFFDKGLIEGGMRKEEGLRVVELLRAKGCEKEAGICLKEAEDGHAPEAEAMVHTLAPTVALIVNVARGLDGCHMVQQASHALVQSAIGVSTTGRKAMLWLR